MKNFTASVILFAVAIVSLSYGNILLKLGMDRYGALTAAGLTAGQALGKAPQLIGGVTLMLVQFICTLILFKWGWEASVVIPVLGLCYLVMAVLARWMLGEPVNATRWFGISLIVLGVFFVARSATTVKIS